jgi:hypothetical protein
VNREILNLCTFPNIALSFRMRHRVAEKQGSASRRSRADTRDAEALGTVGDLLDESVARQAEDASRADTELLQ